MACDSWNTRFRQAALLDLWSFSDSRLLLRSPALPPTFSRSAMDDRTSDQRASSWFATPSRENDLILTLQSVHRGVPTAVCQPSVHERYPKNHDGRGSIRRKPRVRGSTRRGRTSTYPRSASSPWNRRRFEFVGGSLRLRAIPSAKP